MVLFNYSTRELTAKVVYYGPGICGKTTNLQFIHENLPGEVRGKMLALATKTDRTLFFDFLPIDLGEIRGMKTRVQLYTVPGQVFYNETRKLVLKGVDGIVFVADSQETMLGANVESFKNLEENLKAHGMKLSEIPHVIQFNKRDLPKLSPIEDMNAALNKYNAPFYESVATTGIGVQDTLKAIVKLVLLNLTKKYEPKSVPAQAAAAPVPVAPVAAVGAATTARAAMPAAAPSLSTSQPASIPLSPVEAPAPAPTRRGSASHAPAARTAPPPPVETMAPFLEEEIDGLVDEVEDFTPPAAPVPVDDGAWMGDAPPNDSGHDLHVEAGIDRGSGHAWDQAKAPVASREESAPAPHAATSGGESQVLLTEVASDDDLFSDPSLEVAHLAEGEAKEIIVPIMLGEGRTARRFKLAIRLRLDPVN